MFGTRIDWQGTGLVIGASLILAANTVIGIVDSAARWPLWVNVVAWAYILGVACGRRTAGLGVGYLLSLLGIAAFTVVAIWGLCGLLVSSAKQVAVGVGVGVAYAVQWLVFFEMMRRKRRETAR